MSSGDVDIRIAPDRCQATLAAAANRSARVTVESLRTLVEKAGVASTPDVEAALSTFVEEYGDGATAHEAVIAEATPPIHGVDGAIDWDPQLNLEGAEAPCADCKVDHYEGQSFPRVAAGDVIGRLREATSGEPGVDVTGAPLEARDGEAVELTFDPDTIIVEADGSIRAKVDGVVVLDESAVRISETLEITGDVDFNTGHVEFEGSVQVAGGVKPGFRIKAEGELRVGQLIESGEIITGGDFVCSSGFVGQNGGSLDIGGDARLRYLDKVKGIVRGDLEVANEIIDCDLTLGGSLVCDSGAILGGEIEVTGSLKVAVLGSDAWAPTTIILGSLPLLVGDRRALVATITRLQEKRAGITVKEDMIRQRARPSPGEKEMLTEFVFEGSQVDRELEPLTTKLAEIDTVIRSKARVDVHVSKVIYPKVKLVIGPTTVLFKEEVRGPMWIGWDDNQRLTVRNQREGARPLAETATIYQENLAA